MKTIRHFTSIVALFVATGAWADVGMITQLSGDVSLTAEAGGKQTAVSFLKVNTGDKVMMGNGARVQLVYFGNGRQEVWSGSGTVEVGSLESKSSLKPEVTQLPTLVINRLAKTPAAGQQGRTGAVRTRSLLNPYEVADLDKQYQEMKSNTAANDTTPEVFLLSGLIEIKEVARAREVLAKLDGQPQYQTVVAHFKPLLASSAK